MGKKSYIISMLACQVIAIADFFIDSSLITYKNTTFNAIPLLLYRILYSIIFGIVLFWMVSSREKYNSKWNPNVLLVLVLVNIVFFVYIIIKFYAVPVYPLILTGLYGMSLSKYKKEHVEYEDF